MMREPVEPPSRTEGDLLVQSLEVQEPNQFQNPEG